ncbi:TraR/DksA family transcriptional regulator [Carboxylicivirga sp. M1479]|uniref:TraR/DksA family transcriptional regulator n=1 Tax=Carboxylicivirga sp. M1479 TaxID=2594476 RepID=UPI0011783CF6|nr:TraR/DksA family transcriptional regulator [Carboxylicivirga sp. M1479]TRX71373.1 TraR/DksA family transcriptional regulator [Carboxylicivirga sp. M1479]
MPVNVDEIKPLIHKQIEIVERKVKSLKELTQAIAPDDAIGRVSRMDAINNKSVNDAALRQAESKLKNLNDALERIHDADFGLCIKCKGAIQPGRLVLMPESLKCMRCAR